MRTVVISGGNSGIWPETTHQPGWGWKMKRIGSLLLGLFGTGCATTTTARWHLPPLQTVAHVDLQRYLGTWYEIANFRG